MTAVLTYLALSPVLGWALILGESAAAERLAPQGRHAAGWSS